MLHGRTLLRFALVLFSVAAQGQNSANCHRHTLIVGALDTAGLPIKGVAAASFKATYRGRPVHILSSEFVERPTARIVVLLDTSGSMRDSRLDSDRNKWKSARTAATELVSSAPPRMQIAVFTFANKAEKRFELASEHKVIEEWLRAPSTQDISKLKGKTALYNAILEALKELEPAQLGDAIYVITDGGENASAESKSRIGLALQASGVRLFVFLLNGPTLNPAEDADRLDVHDLALGSGGFGTNVGPYSITARMHGSYDYDDNVVARIRAWTQVLEAEIGNFYVLQVETPETSSKAGKWTLEVVDAQGRKRKDVTVVYPQPLAGCETQPAHR